MADLARREPGDALSQIIGTGDTRAMLEQVERNVRDIIDVARARGFVRRYGEGQQEFYGEPAWSLLGMTYGLVPFVEWTKPVDNGWEARAVVRTREGAEVAAAEAMCTRAERNRRNADDHTLRAMAQTRARRNALRGALGAALVLAGFDFADPDAPATADQKGLLHQLARELGYSDKEKHDLAGVASFSDLTREQAGEVIDRWQQEVDRPAVGDMAASSAGTQTPEASRTSTAGKPGLERSADPQDSSSTARSTPEEEAGTSGEPGKSSRQGEGAADRRPPEDPSLDAPASEEQWQRARSLGLTNAKALRKARERWGVTRDSDISKGQLAALLEEHLG